VYPKKETLTLNIAIDEEKLEEVAKEEQANNEGKFLLPKKRATKNHPCVRGGGMESSGGKEPSPPSENRIDLIVYAKREKRTTWGRGGKPTPSEITQEESPSSRRREYYKRKDENLTIPEKGERNTLAPIFGGEKKKITEERVSHLPPSDPGKEKKPRQGKKKRRNLIKKKKEARKEKKKRRRYKSHLFPGAKKSAASGGGGRSLTTKKEDV